MRSAQLVWGGLFGLAAGGIGYLLTQRTGLVQNRIRARGAHPAMLRLLDLWEQEGWFPITVAPEGGLRTDAAKQAGYCKAGLSNACTLDQTPHGRGGALDLWPVGFDPRIPLDQQPEIRDAWQLFGAWGEAKGYRWGGRWTSPVDYPHFELGYWSQLPYPPTTTVTGAYAGVLKFRRPDRVRGYREFVNVIRKAA